MKSKMSRAPFAPISQLLEVPVALFEINALIDEGRLEDAKALVESVIKITLADPHAWLKIAKLQPEEANIESKG